MSLREEGIKHREGAINQALQGIRQNLETLEVIGFRLLDHPIAGLATDLEKFHTMIVKAEKAHAEHMTKKMAPVVAPQVQQARDAIAESRAADGPATETASEIPAYQPPQEAE